MKSVQWVYTILFLAILVLLIGCSPQTTGISVDALQATADEIVRQTETAIPLPTVKPFDTLTPVPVITRPTLTETPTSTPVVTNTVTYTPTAVAYVNLTGDTNCRLGPGTNYGFVTLIQAGQTAEVIGKDQAGNYWVVNNPNGEGTCWIWNAFATASGSVNRIRVMKAPATLTPTRTVTSTPQLLASIRYYRLITCDGSDAIVIRIYNYSRRDFDSWRAQVFEPDRTLQTEVSSGEFAHTYTSCEQTVNSIGYRSTGYAIIPVDTSAAPRFLIEFDVCASEGRERDCLFSGIYVNSPYFTQTPTPTRTPTLTPTITLTATP